MTSDQKLAVHTISSRTKRIEFHVYENPAFFDDLRSVLFKKYLFEQEIDNVVGFREFRTLKCQKSHS